VSSPNSTNAKSDATAFHRTIMRGRSRRREPGSHATPSASSFISWHSAIDTATSARGRL
jgi:hypothetical protein